MQHSYNYTAWAAYHDFTVISSITPVTGLFPARKGARSLKKIPTEQNGLFVVCLINKPFQMNLIGLAYENCNKGNE